MADMQSMLDVANAQNCTLKRESRQLKGQLEEARDEVENANATKATLQRELQETVQEVLSFHSALLLSWTTPSTIYITLAFVFMK